MGDTVVPTETAPTEPLQPASTQVTPTAGNDEQASAELKELQDRLSKMEMERNLLRKKADAAEKEKQERERKELEEKEDYRTLAERAVAEAEALRKEKQERELASAREATTASVFSEFDQRVVAVAKTAGISATDDTEEAKTALKDKLAAIQKELGITTKTPTPTPNNPGERTPATPEFKIINPAGYKDNAEARAQVIMKNSGTVQQRLKNSSAIAAMKQISGMSPQEL